MSIHKITVWEMNGPMNQGGTESLIMELLRNKPDEIDVKLVIHSSTENYSGTYDSEIESLGIEVYHLPAIGRVGVKKYQTAFRELVEQIGKPDIIHNHMNAVGGLISKVGLAYDIPCRIVHCHADIKYRGSRLSILKNEMILLGMKLYVNKYANYFWACSIAAAKRLFYKDKEYTIIPNMINVEKYLASSAYRVTERKKLFLKDNQIVVGAVGRIAKIKNYEVILKAIKLLRDQHIDVIFVCYGRVVDEKYYKELLDIATNEKISDYILFMGGTDQVDRVISAFDVYVMPSITEGLGISALEAQAAGIQTILSTGIPTETDLDIGLVTRVEPNNPEKWADAICHIKKVNVENEKILQSFKSKGYYSKIESRKVFQLYQDMVKKGGDMCER